MDLFQPFTIKGMTTKNRIVMPPMCQYSAKDGQVNAWHMQHYTSRAVGQIGTIIIEMTDVSPEGRITDHDLGLWEDAQIAPLKELIASIKALEPDVKIGIQLAHAGRKAEDAPEIVAPSALAFSEEYKVPHALTTEETKAMVQKFQAAAIRALTAGVDFIELHGAHGYLIHQFQSKRTNQRVDEYQELPRFGVEVIQAVKAVMPEEMPLFFRISALEYAPDGYDLEQGCDLAKAYQVAGVDVFHVSSGGESTVGPAVSPKGYQLEAASAIKKVTGLPTIAVGRLEEFIFADGVIASGQADMVAIGRGVLADPYWPIHAAQTLGYELAIPKQYTRGIRFKKTV